MGRDLTLMIRLQGRNLWQEYIKSPPLWWVFINLSVGSLVIFGVSFTSDDFQVILLNFSVGVCWDGLDD